MRTCDGLSLTEVLVSLFLVTSASLAFIQQQSHISQVIRQIVHRSEAMLQLDNASEQLLAHRRVGLGDSSHLLQRKTEHHTVLKALWDSEYINRLVVK